MHRLKIRAQFQAALAARVVAKTAHFALHRLALGGVPVPQSPLASLIPLATPAADPAHGNAAPLGQPLFAARGVWMGALVPKRWARHAVTRNAIRRQIYAVASEFETRLCADAHVVRLRQGFDRRQYTSASSQHLRADVRAELQQLFGRVAVDAARGVQGADR